MTDRTTYERLELLENKIEGILNFTSRLIYYGDLSKLTLGHNDKILALQEQTRGVVANLRVMESHLKDFDLRITKTENALAPYFVTEKAEKLDVAPELLTVSLDDFIFYSPHVSNVCRLINCFKAGEIYSIGDLLEKTEVEIMRIPNFGLKCLKELKAALAEKGLKLKDA